MGACGALIAVGVSASSVAGPLLSGCRARLSVIARGQGAPDDLAWDGRELLVSDINRGTIGVVAGGRTHTLIGGIREPEGIVPRSPTRLEVAAQATNRVLDIDLKRHSHTVLATLPSVPMKTGVDDIAAAPDGGTYVPDSANGDLYVLRGSHLKLFAGGMNRPVDVSKWGNGTAVADEYANTVWMIKGHRRTTLGAIPLPDDLAVVSGHLIAVSLLGAVWEVAPHLQVLSRAFRNPQGLVAAGSSTVIVADQTYNAIYRLAGLSACL